MDKKASTVADMNGKTVASFEFFLNSWKWMASGLAVYIVAFGVWVVDRDMSNREFQATVTASRFTNTDGQLLHAALDDSAAELAIEQLAHQRISGHPEMGLRVKAVEGTVARLESNQQRILAVQQDTREQVVVIGAKLDRLLTARSEVPQ